MQFQRLCSQHSSLLTLWNRGEHTPALYGKQMQKNSQSRSINTECHTVTPLGRVHAGLPECFSYFKSSQVQYCKGDLKQPLIAPVEAHCLASSFFLLVISILKAPQSPDTKHSSESEFERHGTRMRGRYETTVQKKRSQTLLWRDMVTNGRDLLFFQTIWIITYPISHLYGGLMGQEPQQRDKCSDC